MGPARGNRPRCPAEAGAPFDAAGIETLSEAAGLTTSALRRMNAKKVPDIRRGASVTRADAVTDTLKARRLTSAIRCFDFVGRVAEAWLPKGMLAMYWLTVGVPLSRRV